MPRLIQHISPDAPMPEPYVETHLVVGQYRVALRAALVNDGATLGLQSLWSPVPLSLSRTDAARFRAAREAAMPALLARLLP